MSNSWFDRTFWFVAIALVATVSHNAYHAYFPRAALHPLRCDESVFNFGQVRAGTSIQHTFRLINADTEPLSIGKVWRECGCMELLDNPEGRAMIPGDTCDLGVKLNLSDSITGKVQRKVVVVSNGSSPSYLTLKLMGAVEPAFSIEN